MFEKIKQYIANKMEYWSMSPEERFYSEATDLIDLECRMREWRRPQPQPLWHLFFIR